MGVAKSVVVQVTGHRSQDRSQRPPWIETSYMKYWAAANENEILPIPSGQSARSAEHWKQVTHVTLKSLFEYPWGGSMVISLSTAYKINSQETLWGASGEANGDLLAEPYKISS